MNMTKQASELTKELISLTNVIGKEDEIAQAMVKTIMSDHRTLQQAFWRVMNKVIVEYGKQASEYKDARNEGAVQSCKALTPVIEEQYLPFI